MLGLWTKRRSKLVDVAKTLCYVCYICTGLVLSSHPNIQQTVTFGMEMFFLYISTVWLNPRFHYFPIISSCWCCLCSVASLAQISLQILSLLIIYPVGLTIRWQRPKQIMFPRVFSKNRPGFIFSANLCCELVIRRRASGPINTAHWSVLPGGGARQRRSSEWTAQKSTSAACDTEGRADDVFVLSAFLQSVMMLFFFPGVANVVL